MKKSNKKNSSYFHDAVERFMHHKLAVVGLAVVTVEILLLVILPVIMNLEPNAVTPAVNMAPDKTHLLGTDTYGRDTFARLIYGGRTSLKIGFFSVLVQAAIGIPLGIIAGYYRKAAEVIIMRLADMFQSIPSMCLNIVLVSVLSPSAETLILVIGVMGWPSFVRLLYAKVLSVREKEYVEAARTTGTGNLGIMLKYILPNSISPALVAFTFGIPSAILTESALSFLGLGIQIPEASWGNMLNAAQSVAIISTKPWLWIPAGMCIFITLISVNLFGDGLRDALDPKTKIG
ncbi:ABC transporter permease [Murimonas intestini]|uniref:Peptide/nickel transport system permease protein n=1 Tax=Murimonas intestini TaxID=1337051 RepID=A0AB73T9D7_9FIRM|nr:ABC transporter permease [Murimonas intestini]MCR1864586.1 ABC transporter permease [Murimonas intestini]MCR1882196.1 ABC transporter permease [Murimonas intestini]